jgi:hypothetical protein
MQETVFGTPSPNLSPKGERNMNHERRNLDSKVRATLAEVARRA